MPMSSRLFRQNELNYGGPIHSQPETHYLRSRSSTLLAMTYRDYSTKVYESRRAIQFDAFQDNGCRERLAFNGKSLKVRTLLPNTVSQQQFGKSL